MWLGQSFYLWQKQRVFGRSSFAALSGRTHLFVFVQYSATEAKANWGNRFRYQLTGLGNMRAGWRTSRWILKRFLFESLRFAEMKFSEATRRTIIDREANELIVVISLPLSFRNGFRLPSSKKFLFQKARSKDAGEADIRCSIFYSGKKLAQKNNNLNAKTGWFQIMGCGILWATLMPEERPRFSYFFVFSHAARNGGRFKGNEIRCFSSFRGFEAIQR